MPNTFKKFLMTCFLVLFIGTNATVAGAAQTETVQHINNTIAHLEEALKAVNANNLEVAQDHIEAAGQSSKLIIGGSYEARKQRGARAITKIRRQISKGDTDGIAASLTGAIEAFKSLLQPVKTEASGQGGL